ncbi:hypothetical protein BC628DRAFT_1412599 [Trametes gibbosa]|nr:hypothetical protein BC628DRAFT_1412599 [Trametes gibbosa]
MRNTKRTAQMWKTLNRRAEETEKKKRKASHSDSSGSEAAANSSPRSRTKKMKRRPQKKDGVLPDWTRKGINEIIVSSDSDDDILAPKKVDKPAGGGTVETPRGIRARSRSRSLTPPPALPAHALQRAREAVDRVIGAAPRAPSPTDFADDSFDTVVSDPELASIARRVKSELQRNGGTPIPEEGGPTTVKLKIIWRPHPLDAHGRSTVWGAEQKRHENFHNLCAEIADLAGVRLEHLVLLYDDKRVFASSTPHSIGIWAEAELYACDQTTSQYLQENKRLRSESVAPIGSSQAYDSGRSPPHARSPSVTELSDPDMGGPPSEHEHKDEKPADTIRLVVRSERTKGRDISLLVRPTTKCGAIVRAFLKKAGLEAEYPADAPAGKTRGRGKAPAAKNPALCVDGEKMGPETEIGDADLEDGDQVDVVGL